MPCRTLNLSILHGFFTVTHYHAMLENADFFVTLNFFHNLNFGITTMMKGSNFSNLWDLYGGFSLKGGYKFFVYYNSWNDGCPLFICILCLFIITKLHLILLLCLVFRDFASCFFNLSQRKGEFLNSLQREGVFLNLLQYERVFWWSGGPKVIPLFRAFCLFFSDKKVS